MFVHPGTTIRRILEGEREPLTEPLRFVILSVATVVVAMALSMSMTISDGGFAPESVRQMERDAIVVLNPQIAEMERIKEDTHQSPEVRFRATQAKAALLTSIGAWSFQAQAPWNNVILLMVVPIYAVCTRFVISRNLNLAEHLVMNAYIYGVQCLMGTILMVPLMLTGQVVLGGVLYMAASLIYQIFAWNSILHFRSILGWLKCAFLVVFTLVIYIIFMAVMTSLVLFFNLILQ